MRMTTARYFTPSRQVIHEVGVSPNVRALLTRQQEFELLESRRDHGFGKSGVVSTEGDPQLSRAVDVLQGTLIFVQRQQPPKAEPAGKSS